MKRKAGFTLVELLVVMAIIAILASIVVPNVINYIRDARATEALSEIRNVDLAVTKMLTDADRNSLNELFNAPAIDAALGAGAGALHFAAATELYTNIMYTLLRSGRGALQDEYGAYLNPTIVKKLGLNYINLGLDPWGELYQFYPGPWTASPYFRDSQSPPVFRVYAADEEQSKIPGQQGGAKQDAFTVTAEDNVYDPVTDELVVAGFSGPMQHTVYIWSKGENTINDQAIYGLSGGGGAAAYQQQPDVQFYGGGDDINNWDNGRSWERHYN